MRHVFLFLLLLTPVFGQTISGWNLNIGPSGSNQLNSDFSGALGEGNRTYNSWWGYSRSHLLVGNNNLLDEGVSNLLVGSWNQVEATSRVLIVGSGNEIASAWFYGNDQPDRTGSNGVIFGTANHIGGFSDGALIAGTNNFVDAQWTGPNTAPISATTTLGRGLINKWSDSTVVGRYNDSTIGFNTGLLFAVGSGVSSQNRSNAFEVYSDGKVKLPRQGDVLMGEFGQSGD